MMDMAVVEGVWSINNCCECVRMEMPGRETKTTSSISGTIRVELRANSGIHSRLDKK